MLLPYRSHLPYARSTTLQPLRGARCGCRSIDSACCSKNSRRRLARWLPTLHEHDTSAIWELFSPTRSNAERLAASASLFQNVTERSAPPPGESHYSCRPCLARHPRNSRPRRCFSADTIQATATLLVALSCSASGVLISAGSIRRREKWGPIHSRSTVPSLCLRCGRLAQSSEMTIARRPHHRACSFCPADWQH